MSLATFLALLLYSFTTSITPGPNNIMLFASGVNFGIRRTVPHMLGIAFGFTVLLVSVGFGLGAVLTAIPAAFLALKIAGGAYMIYLAWKIAGSGPVEAAEGSSRPMTFLQAALFQWVNPKAWVMAMVAMAAYTVPGHYATNVMIVALTFAAVNLPSVSIWAVFGASMRRFLADPVKLRIFNVSMAIALVVSLWPMLNT